MTLEHLIVSSLLLLTITVFIIRQDFKNLLWLILMVLVTYGLIFLTKITSNIAIAKLNFSLHLMIILICIFLGIISFVTDRTDAKERKQSKM